MVMGGRRENDEAAQMRKLFIGGLSFRTTEDGLKEHFGTWGEIVDVVVLKDKSSGKSKGFGFITYKEPSSVDDAQAQRPHTIDGKQVQTKRAIPREESGKPESNITVEKLFVKGKGKSDLDEDALKNYFSTFGNIKTVDVIKDKNTGEKKGFAFVEFDDYDPVDKAIIIRDHFVDGKKIEVKKAISKAELQSANEKLAAKAPQESWGGSNAGPWGNSGGYSGYGGNSGGYGGGYDQNSGYGGGYGAGESQNSGYGGGYGGGGISAWGNNGSGQDYNQGYNQGYGGGYNQGYGGGPQRSGFSGGNQRQNPYNSRGRGSSNGRGRY